MDEEQARQIQASLYLMTGELVRVEDIIAAHTAMSRRRTRCEPSAAMNSAPEKVLRAPSRSAVLPKGSVARRVGAFGGGRKKCSARLHMTHRVTSGTARLTRQKVLARSANLARRFME